MDLLTEMRIPTRAAPKPPGTSSSQQKTFTSSFDDVWGSGSDDLFGSSLQVPPKKKPPPPRPPPPNLKNLQKLGTVNIQEKPKKPARPTELLSNLFGRRGSKQHTSTSTTMTTYSSRTTTNHSLVTQPPASAAKTEGCLIDLSPPGSPTFTTRSSDGVSVDSFGSDGNSNPSVFTSSGSCSQTESAFEDDFDFFGSLSSSKKNQPINDPWKVSSSQDPFGSFDSKPDPFGSQSRMSFQQWPLTNSQPVKEVGESNFFVERTIIDNLPEPPKPKPFKMPTIIWPAKKSQDKSSKDSTPKQSPVHIPAKSTFVTNNYSNAPRLDTYNDNEKLDCWDDDNISDKSSSSPPMPKLPPPPPPSEYIAGLEDGLIENSDRPYGVALYDFPAAQAGDLELKEGDVIYLIKLVDDSWMEGQVGSRQGMFPINFVDIKIPLPGLSTNVVNALYTFKAETSDDLSFEEGARIKVLSKISEDWLYGEFEGKKGQFPANFVDKVPIDLPNHS